MDRTYTKMIKEDEGTRLSEVTLARRLLRRSGLNHDEQRHVLASCGHEYNLDKIRTALRLTYGDANRDDSRRRFSQAPSAAPIRKPGFGGGGNKKPPFTRFQKHGVNQLDALPEEDPQDDHEQVNEDQDEEDHGDGEDEEQQDDDEQPDEEDEEGSNLDEDDK